MAKSGKSRLRLRWWKSGNDSSYSLLHYRCPSDSFSLYLYLSLGFSRRIAWHPHLAFSSSSHSSGIIKYHWTCITLDFLLCLIHPLYFILSCCCFFACSSLSYVFFFPFYKSSCMSPPTTPYNPQSMIPYFTYFPSSGFFCTKCDTMTMTPDPIDNLYLLLLHSSPVSSPSPQHRHQHYPSQHHHHL